MAHRPLTQNEHTILSAWLQQKTQWSGDLLQQLRNISSVSPGCECGCGSIEIIQTEAQMLHKVDLQGEYPVWGLIEDGAIPRGHMNMFLNDGLIERVEVSSFLDGPLLFPSPNEVTWGGRRGDHSVLGFGEKLIIRAMRLGPDRELLTFYPGFTLSEFEFAAITTIHDEYDPEAGHIGPLRGYLVFFDKAGKEIPSATFASDSEQDAMNCAADLKLPSTRWLQCEDLPCEDGSLPSPLLLQL